MKSLSSQLDLPYRSETVLFVGAGATAQLNCPPSCDQGRFLWSLCDRKRGQLREADLKEFHCFKGFEQSVCDLLNLLDYEGENRTVLSDDQRPLLDRCFPNVAHSVSQERVLALRDVFDGRVLKLVARAKRATSTEFSSLFIQDVFTLIDACLREDRGFTVYEKDSALLLRPERLRAARRMVVHLINVMFACAYQNLLKDPKQRQVYKQYADFASTLSRMMLKEGESLQDHPFASRKFYLFSYSIVTTNFEPFFLWLFFQAHLKLNHEGMKSIGEKRLELFYDFPNTMAMYRLADRGEKLIPDLFHPMSEAAVQMVNHKKHGSVDRLIRIGKYYFVHGSSNFRHCPKCGRLNLYLGDSWDEQSPSLFPAGLTAPFLFGNQPRTALEKRAHERGEYDAKSCLFCGELTYTQDNEQFMQTLLKTDAPSFIKEITDEALAALSGAKHIVLLGYRVPPDDAIWSAMFTTISQRPSNEPLYCSVVCGYSGGDEWLYGERLERYVKDHDNKDAFGAEAVKNAMALFGANHVRAYTGGIPRVFHQGDEGAVRELLYPFRHCPKEWDTSSWLKEGRVARRENGKENWIRIYP